MILIPDSHRVYLLGDLHEALPRASSSIEAIEQPATLILLGDYDAYDSDRVTSLRSYFESLNLPSVLLRGNHDNTSFWRDRAMAKELGGQSLYLTEEIDVIEWRGKKILTVNGAISVDRKRLRFDEGHCWPNTEPVAKDAVAQIQKLKQEHGGFDILLSHTGIIEEKPIRSPFVESYASTDETLISDLEAERKLMLQIQIASGVKQHYFGHFHTSVTEEQFGKHIQCLDIAEMVELK